MCFFVDLQISKANVPPSVTTTAVPTCHNGAVIHDSHTGGDDSDGTITGGDDADGTITGNMDDADVNKRITATGIMDTVTADATNSTKPEKTTDTLDVANGIPDEADRVPYFVHMASDMFDGTSSGVHNRKILSGNIFFF